MKLKVNSKSLTELSQTASSVYHMRGIRDYGVARMGIRDYGVARMGIRDYGVATPLPTLRKAA